MAKFSETVGAQPARSVIQVTDLDHPTRIALWSSFHSTVSDMNDRGWQANRVWAGNTLLRDMWANELERPIDEYKPERATAVTKDIYVNAEWWRVLDHVQWVATTAEKHWRGSGSRYQKTVETDLERYLVGYRFLTGELIPVSHEMELRSIREAGTSGGGMARTHLQRAISLLSNRENPQYAKVVQEAVNAVESVVADLTGQSVLSVGLKQLEAKGFPVHKALLGAWDKLYGYTSDAGGIRHGLIREEDVDETLAVYFLVSCSAFVNMLMKVAAATH